MVHQYKALCFACHYSLLVSLLFLSKNKLFFKCNCTYSESLFFWLASLFSSSRLLLSQPFKGKSELFQQSLTLLNTQLRDRTHKVQHWNLRQQESPTFLINFLLPNQNKQKHHCYCPGKQVHNIIHPL